MKLFLISFLVSAISCFALVACTPAFDQHPEIPFLSDFEIDSTNITTELLLEDFYVKQIDEFDNHLLVLARCEKSGKLNNQEVEDSGVYLIVYPPDAEIKCIPLKGMEKKLFVDGFLNPNGDYMIHNLTITYPYTEEVEEVTSYTLEEFHTHVVEDGLEERFDEECGSDPWYVNFKNENHWDTLYTEVFDDPVLALGLFYHLIRCDSAYYSFPYGIRWFDGEKSAALILDEWIDRDFTVMDNFEDKLVHKHDLTIEPTIYTEEEKAANELDFWNGDKVSADTELSGGNHYMPGFKSFYLKYYYLQFNKEDFPFKIYGKEMPYNFFKFLNYHTEKQEIYGFGEKSYSGLRLLRFTKA